MKKVLTMMAVVAVASVATADLAYFAFQGGKLLDSGGVALPVGSITDGAVVQLVDLSVFVSDGRIDIADIPAAFAIANVGNTPVFAGIGGAYASDSFSERPSANIDAMAYFVFDPNGGGIQLGDFIGIGGGALIQDMAVAGDPAPANPQTMILVGDITAGVEVIPEPATFGLMGIAGLGMFLARRKARR